MTEWAQAQLSVHTIPPRKDLKGGHLPSKFSEVKLELL